MLGAKIPKRVSSGDGLEEILPVSGPFTKRHEQRDGGTDTNHAFRQLNQRGSLPRPRWGNNREPFHNPDCSGDSRQCYSISLPVLVYSQPKLDDMLRPISRVTERGEILTGALLHACWHPLYTRV